MIKALIYIRLVVNTNTIRRFSYMTLGLYIITVQKIVKTCAKFNEFLMFEVNVIIAKTEGFRKTVSNMTDIAHTTWATGKTFHWR